MVQLIRLSLRDRRRRELGSAALIMATIFSAMMAGTAAMLTVLNDNDLHRSQQDKAKKSAHAAGVDGLEILAALLSNYQIYQHPWDDGTNTWQGQTTTAGVLDAWQFYPGGGATPD